jgi:altronate hydrolase
MKLLVHIHPDDNVAVAPQAIAAGTREDGLVFADIPAGHKAALRPIAAGEPVIKYGFPIGLATADIAPGEHVHVHAQQHQRLRGGRHAGPAQVRAAVRAHAYVLRCIGRTEGEFLGDAATVNEAR